jgi:hypothetical protein
MLWMRANDFLDNIYLIGVIENDIVLLRDQAAACAAWLTSGRRLKAVEGRRHYRERCSIA